MMMMMILMMAIIMTMATMIYPYFRHPPSREPAYWSRQSLAASSPSPVETEMDLLVLRERSRRGIRNSGYDVRPY